VVRVVGHCVQRERVRQCRGGHPRRRDGLGGLEQRRQRARRRARVARLQEALRAQRPQRRAARRRGLAAGSQSRLGRVPAPRGHERLQRGRGGRAHVHARRRGALALLGQVRAHEPQHGGAVELHAHATDSVRFQLRYR
jgi:hypothetical protein